MINNRYQLKTLIRTTSTGYLYDANDTQKIIDKIFIKIVIPRPNQQINEMLKQIKKFKQIQSRYVLQIKDCFIKNKQEVNVIKQNQAIFIVLQNRSPQNFLDRVLYKNIEGNIIELYKNITNAIYDININYQLAHANICLQNIIYDNKHFYLLNVGLPQPQDHMFMNFIYKNNQFQNIRKQNYDLWSFGIALMQLISPQFTKKIIDNPFLVINNDDSIKDFIEKIQSKLIQYLVRNLLDSNPSNRKYYLIIKDRYLIQNNKHIDEGGYGIVYDCIDVENSNIPKAIKMIQSKKEGMTNKQIKKSFEQEVIKLKKLNHKNIVKYYDSFEYNFPQSSNYFIVMQRIQGDNLITKIQKLNQDQIIEIYLQLKNILQYLKQQKIIHRDISLDNILYTNGIIYLIDFGIACQNIQDQPILKTIHNRGKKAYKDPKIYQSFQYCYQSDLWSLGIVLLSLVTHTPPQNFFIEEKLPKDFPFNEFKKIDNKNNKMISIIQSLLKQGPKDRQMKDIKLSKEIKFITLTQKYLDRLIKKLSQMTQNPEVIQLKFVIAWCKDYQDLIKLFKNCLKFSNLKQLTIYWPDCIGNQVKIQKELCETFNKLNNLQSVNIYSSGILNKNGFIGKLNVNIQNREQWFIKEKWF